MSNFFTKDYWVKTPETGKTDKKPTSSAPQTLSSASATPPVASIKTGTDYGKVLDNALEAGNQEGFDFREFKLAIEEQQATVLPENTKYENTFNVVKSLGVTAEKLVASGEHYLEILDNEHSIFDRDWNAHQAKDVEAKKVIIESLTQENIKLNAKIQANSESAQKLNTEIFASTQLLSNEKQGFENELNIRKNIINEVSTKIKTYLYGKSAK